MPIGKASLRGYILEEVLAYLIKPAGYSLLIDENQDTRELIKMSAGIGVKGRGGNHQADVLGQLEWVPAFTFPLRLFVEAKFWLPTPNRKNSVGINWVRHAVGVVLDINQNNYPLIDRLSLQRYHYAYALFSTSGFSKNAMTMALAHQISLIDLSGPDFSDLRTAIDAAAAALLPHFRSQVDEDVSNSSDDSQDDEQTMGSTGNSAIVNMRNNLRTAFNTIPLGVRVELHDRDILEPILRPVINKANMYRELFVGMPDGPFILLLKADDPGAFLEYASAHPRHKVKIRWRISEDRGKTWKIYPVDNPDAYQLSFRLPELLRHWIYRSGSDSRVLALQAKERYLSSVSICHFENGVGKIFKLDYDPTDEPTEISENNPL